MRATFALALACGAALCAQPPAVEWGFEQRVRNENWNNLLDFNDGADDQRVQVRYRTRLWMNLPVAETVDINIGLNQETNQIILKRAPYRMDEVVFESAYVDFKKVFVKGLSLRVGRQNLIRGEGFLMLEGNPYDGSRSIYFNAADLAYSWKKSKLELLAISDPVKDRYFPRFNNRSKPLVEWNERALGLYYTDKNRARLPFEAYYFYKKETGDTRPASNIQYQPDRRLHTAGARAVRELTPRLSLTAEWAGQWGRQHGGKDLAGWGGYTYLKRTFAGPCKPYLLGGWWGFSKEWDPLFGRWPKWSELYIYTQWKEKGVAYWTNTGMWQGEAGATWKSLGGRLTYYHMSAFQPFPGSPALYGNGLFRGNHYQARLDAAAGKHWKGHVLWEHHLPGDFYAHRDNAYFLRFEVIFLLTGKASL
ncbi:MAG: alginate export family protein [Bryobacteraceae bacterium]